MINTVVRYVSMKTIAKVWKKHECTKNNSKKVSMLALISSNLTEVSQPFDRAA